MGLKDIIKQESKYTKDAFIGTIQTFTDLYGANTPYNLIGPKESLGHKGARKVEESIEKSKGFAYFGMILGGIIGTPIAVIQGAGLVSFIKEVNKYPELALEYMSTLPPKSIRRKIFPKEFFKKDLKRAIKQRSNYEHLRK